jgi:hypothetical protein
MLNLNVDFSGFKRRDYEKLEEYCMKIDLAN